MEPAHFPSGVTATGLRSREGREQGRFERGNPTGPTPVDALSLRGRALGTAAPTVGQTLVYDGTSWVPGSGIQGYEIVSNTCNPGTSCFVGCPAGKRVLGGGCNANGGYPYQSIPNGSGPNTWYCSYYTGAGYVTAYAICAY